MALTSDNPVKATELVALKAKVKAEMQRRNQSGSVSSYGGSAYDYNSTDNPVVDQPLHREAYNKIITPARAVNSANIPGVIATGDVLPAINEVNSRIDAWRTRSITDRTASDCASGCTGTCYTGCASGCYTGCTNACQGCGSGCATSCTGGCGGGCGGGCSGSCGGCGGGCGDGCSGGCESNCASGCDNSCTAYCAGGCSNTCGAGCSDGCQSSCWAFCSNGSM